MEKGVRIKYEDFVETYSKYCYLPKYYLKVLQKSKQGWNVKKISKYFGVPYRTIWRWVKKKDVPIPFIEYQKIKKEFNEKEINNLAPILGNIFGDGGIRNNGNVHYSNSERFLINEFVTNINKVFNKESVSIKERENIIGVGCSSRIGRSLWCLFGKFSFGKDTKTMTPQIQNMPLEWKARMLRSWFNDDGSVPKQGIVAIKQKLKPLIIFIQNTLSELGIKSIITEDDGRWQLRICSYRHLIVFKEKINFSDGYRKRQKLVGVINNKKYPRLITKNKILELLKESPRTKKEISEILKSYPSNVSSHFHGWKKKDGKRGKGLIDLGFVKVKKKNGKRSYSLADARKNVIDSF